MTQVMHTSTMLSPTSMDKKTYTVNIKGLIAHTLDILFGKGSETTVYYSSDLSHHIQKDLGIKNRF